MKKLVSLLLALVLVCTMSIVAFAADADGSITINGVHEDAVYEIYKLLDLEGFNKDDNAYAYKVNSAWADFFETDAALAYVTIGDDGYVTWKASDSDATMAAFAQLALTYAQDNDIAPVKTTDTPEGQEPDYTVDADGNIVFSGLELGYYLVDSNVGALCGLTTTDKDASINVKNGEPTIDKQVQEDLTGMWGDVNTADIGQIVNYMSIIHVAAGAENYVLHDKMAEGLSFVHDLDEGRGVTSITLTNSQGVESTLTLGTDYTVKTDGFGDECTFEVEFADEFVANLKANDRIIVYYNAMLNRYAQVGPTSGNVNESWLEYGEEHYTTHDQTTTYTFSVDIIKTDSSNKLIDGAEFRVYDAAEGGNEIAVVPLLGADDATPVLDANGNPMYRRARADEEGVNIVVKNGKVTVVGFDNGVYYLEEVVAPAGYNMLTARKEFTIADKNLDSVFNNGIYSTGSGVHVVNRKGSMLPETGGMGTTLFIVFGILAILGTGVVLVTKKRMASIED